MIEYLATAGAVGFAFALVLWRDSGARPSSRWRWPPGSSGCSSSRRPRSSGSSRRSSTDRRREVPTAQRGPHRIWTAVAVGVPLVAAALWTRHADAIKAASPVTEGLTGWNLRRWNFGRAHERLDWDQWDVILQVAVPNLVTLYGLLLVPAAIAVWRSAQWRFWLGIASAAVLPMLVFMNLYVAHDYYLVAVSPAVRGPGRAGRRRAVVRACGLAGSWRRCLSSRSALAWGAVELKAALLVSDPRRLERPDRPAARSRDRIEHGGRRPRGDRGAGLVARGALLRAPTWAHGDASTPTDVALRPDPPGRLPPSGGARP